MPEGFSKNFRFGPLIRAACASPNGFVETRHRKLGVQRVEAMWFPDKGNHEARWIEDQPLSGRKECLVKAHPDLIE